MSNIILLNVSILRTFSGEITLQNHLTLPKKSRQTQHSYELTNIHSHTDRTHSQDTHRQDTHRQDTQPGHTQTGHTDRTHTDRTHSQDTHRQDTQPGHTQTGHTARTHTDRTHSQDTHRHTQTGHTETHRQDTQPHIQNTQTGYTDENDAFPRSTNDSMTSLHPHKLHSLIATTVYLYLGSYICIFTLHNMLIKHTI